MVGPGAGRWPNVELEYPLVEDCPEWDGEILCSAPDWANIFRLAKSSAKKVPGRPDWHGVVIWTTNAGQIVLGTYDTTLRAQAVEGRFPDTDRVWPAKPARWAVSMDPAYLIEAAQIAKEITSETAVGITLVARDTDPFGMVAKNPEFGQVLDVLIMPLATKEQREAQDHAGRPLNRRLRQ